MGILGVFLNRLLFVKDKLKGKNGLLSEWTSSQKQTLQCDTGLR